MDKKSENVYVRGKKGDTVLLLAGGETLLLVNQKRPQVLRLFEVVVDHAA
jgi:predicted regulator of Ras-like GTPase activity (Roadblock/LC7/MglB family)